VRSVAVPGAAFVLLLLLWQAADAIFAFNKVILPSPADIARAFASQYPQLFRETAVTMLESGLGFLAGSVAAVCLATAFVHSRLTQEAVYPFAVALKSTPLIAIAPLLVLWFGNGLLSKVVMSALVAFFPVLVNAVSGLTSVDPEILDLMKSLSASRWQIYRKIRFPNSAGYIFAALKIASSLAVVGAVIGEFTGSTQGIGHLINTSSYYLQTDVVFAAIALISLCGVGFFELMAYLERVVVFWQEPS